MKRYIGVFVICSIAFLLSGCGDGHDLNDLGIASALSIDREGDLYHVAVQLINPDSVRSKSSGGSPVFTYTGKGTTVSGALAVIESQLPRYLFLADLRLVVLSEGVARRYFEGVIDFLLRDPRVRSDFVFVVSRKEKALDVLNHLTPLEEIPAESLFQNLTNYVAGQYIFKNRTIDTIVRDMEVKDVFLPGVTVSGEKEKGRKKDEMDQILIPSRLAAQDIAVFRYNRFVGWTNDVENKGILYLFSKKSEHMLSVSVPGCDEDISVVVKDPCSEITGIFKQGNPAIHININAKAILGESRCDVSDSRQKVTEIERQLDQKIKRDVKECIYGILGKYQADIFGFGWILERNNPDQWTKIKAQWPRLLKNLQVTVDVDTVLEGTGQIYDSVKGRR